MSTGESEEHKAMVRALMNYLNGKGFQTVGVALDGYPQCKPMDERVADFIGKNNQNEWCIGEAKTSEDLINDRERTDAQFRAFASRQATFYILVPKASIEQLNQILKELGLLGQANIETLNYC
ncbi:MAG: hypothetical protein NWF03_00775 [Candidatus Bathyarchaeota archaeon]|nr:hypothetical protein [Candidatus Bathyarchaeota archaeon]